ncbi:MAG: hypothetical protein K8U03_03930 [Planctomycetia bacterium]|nr:hypothetical protein [Planctomycetia bacterium]
MFELATKLKPDEEAPFRIAVESGYRCAELWTGPSVLEDVRHTADLAQRFDLRYSLHFPNRRDLTPRQLRAVVDLYRALDCRSMTIHQLEFDRYAPEIAKLDAGVCLTVENGSLALAEFQRWAEENAFLTLDAEHLWMFTHPGASCAEAAEAVGRLLAAQGAKLRHVHLPGSRGGPEEHRPMYNSREYVFAVLDRLAEVGYEGFVVSEVDLEYQTKNDLTMDRLLFDTWLQTRRISRS